MHAPFCHACGRIISRTAKPAAAGTAPTELQKFCSKGCKAMKPNPVDLGIEARFITHLSSPSTPINRKTGVLCTTIQGEHFGDASEGMERARERERVRRAGRRIVVFSPDRLQDTPLMGKTLECVQNGKPVEGSFAKGDWGVRIVE